MKKRRQIFAVLSAMILALTALQGNVLAAEFDGTEIAESVDFTEGIPEMPEPAEPEQQEQETEIFGSEEILDFSDDAEQGTEAFSDEEWEQIERTEIVHVNPLYADVVEEADLYPAANQRLMRASAGPEYSSVKEAGAEMRKCMKQREETVVLRLQTKSDQYAEFLEAIVNEALRHTGNPTEGDYLKWQFAGWGGALEGTVSGGVYHLVYTYTFTYYTDAAQEAVLDREFKKVMNSLGLSGKSRYEQIRAIYDYICGHTAYDYENLDNDRDRLKFTAYGALINGRAVCQGYAALFYRMALDAGIDVRMIPGNGGGGPHVWNIAALQGRYYNLDLTWDAGRGTYSWFLKSEKNFVKHSRDAEYRTAEFQKSYPMASSDYKPSVCNAHQWSAWKSVSAATVFAAEKQTRSCSLCEITETRTKGKPLTPTMKVSSSRITMKVKQTISSFKVTGMARGDSVASWKSDNEKVVKVSGVKASGTGTIKAQNKPGSATITITLKSGLKKKIPVRVNGIKATGIKNVKSSISLKKGKSTTLKPRLTPSGSTDKITYKSSNSKVATVSSKGKITAKKKGTAKITIKAGKASFQCKVTVK